MHCAFLNEKEIFKTKLVSSCEQVHPSCLASLWHFKATLKAKKLLQKHIQSYFIFNILTLYFIPSNICVNELNYGQNIWVRNDKAVCNENLWHSFHLRSSWWSSELGTRLGCVSCLRPTPPFTNQNKSVSSSTSSPYLCWAVPHSTNGQLNTIGTKTCLHLN